MTRNGVCFGSTVISRTLIAEYKLEEPASETNRRIMRCWGLGLSSLYLIHVRFDFSSQKTRQASNIHAHAAAVSGRAVISHPTYIMSSSVEQRSFKWQRWQLILTGHGIIPAHTLSAVTGGWDPHLVVAGPVSRRLAKRLPKRSSLASPLTDVVCVVCSLSTTRTRHGSDSHTSCSDGATRLDLALAALNLAPLVSLGWFLDSNPCDDGPMTEREGYPATLVQKVFGCEELVPAWPNKAIVVQPCVLVTSG